MILKELFAGIDAVKLSAEQEAIDVEGIVTDSRRAGRGSLFVALRGTQDDGSRYIDDAIQRGCRMIMSRVAPADLSAAICCLTVEDPAAVLRQILRNYYGDISSQIRLVGITGTNGKTTIAHLVYNCFMASGRLCGMMGTINYRIGQRKLPSVNTTPGLVECHEYLSEMIDGGASHCVMEVSSHALEQRRVDVLRFQTAVFTNLTTDHLDYHGTLENYFHAKAKLFSCLAEGGSAVINNDDAFGKKLMSRVKHQLITYGIDQPAHVMAKDIQPHISGTRFKLVAPGGQINIHTALIGRYNIYNILAAAGVCLSEGMSLADIHKGLEQSAAVPGRLEKIECGQAFTVLIDYAHTEDALENMLSTIRDVSGRKIILVFGCGGDRDRSKRPAMARVAQALADQVIVTSDNPRREDPQDIIRDIQQGFTPDAMYEVIPDRTEAIERALTLAAPEDVVIIAGKGHETYQILNDRTIPFDERKIIRDFLQCST